MRLKIHIIFLVLFLPIVSYAGTGNRQYSVGNNVKHHIGLLGGVGYGVLWDNYPEISSVGNVCGLVGLEYEMRINGFWLSFGPEVQYFAGKSLFNTTGTEVNIKDTYGVSAVYHYDFNQGEDYQRMVFANLPITLGYYYKGLYIGVGAKAGYMFYGVEQTRLSYTTTGTYEEYIDDFRQMANHSYGTYYSSVKETITNRLKVSVIGEVGYDVLSWIKYKYDKHTESNGLKISLCVEYGLSNLVGDSKDIPLYVLNESNATEMRINPYYCSRAGNSHHIRPFYAGVKITWLLCVKTKTCNCQENWQYFKKRYNNMVR